MCCTLLNSSGRTFPYHTLTYNLGIKLISVLNWHGGNFETSLMFGNPTSHWFSRLFNHHSNQIADGYPAVAFPSIHLLVESLDLHVITASWDLQFLSCLSESARPKTTAVDVGGMKNGTQASKTGKLFYDTLKVNN